MFAKSLFSLLAACVLVGTAVAKPTVIYSVDGKFNDSFTEADYSAAERFREEPGMAAREGDWQPGVKEWGLVEGGLDWVIDAHNRSLITDQMEAAAEAAEDGIVSGEIQVHDASTQGPCPVK